MRGPWPFPGPRGILGDLFGATFGVGAIVVGILAASVVFVAIVAMLFLVVRFLLATTKAAELYVAERRAAVPAPVAVPASDPEDLDPAPTAPAATDSAPVVPAKPVRAPRTAAKPAGTTTSRTRAPRPPRTPPNA